MKPTSLRAAFLLVLLFGLGAWAGHLATLRWGHVPAENAETASAREDEAHPEISRRALVRITRKVMEHYQEAIGLSEDQMEKLRPLFIRSGQDMARIPRNTPARLARLEQFHREIQPFLTDEQKPLAAQILETAREGR